MLSPHTLDIRTATPLSERLELAVSGSEPRSDRASTPALERWQQVLGGASALDKRLSWDGQAAGWAPAALSLPVVGGATPHWASTLRGVFSSLEASGARDPTEQRFLSPEAPVQ